MHTIFSARSFRDLSSPSAAAVDSFFIHSRAFLQDMSETFTEIHRCFEVFKFGYVRIDLKLVYFSMLLPLCFGVYVIPACSKSISWPSPKKCPLHSSVEAAAYHPDPSRGESGRLQCQPEQASRLRNIASAREAT